MANAQFEQMAGSSIHLSGVSRIYSHGTSTDAGAVGISDVDCDVAAGDYVAVVGPSGSGKTTLLNIIAALDKADSGQVVVAGTDLGRASRSELARFRLNEVGIVFQDSLLVPELSVFANVAMPGVLRKDARRALEKRVLELLERLGLENLADRLPHELSGGQRQRVAVARSVVNSPGLVVADEPTGSLDSAHGSQVIELLEEINLAGATLVMVTHDPSVAARARSQLHVVDGLVSSVLADAIDVP